MASLIFTMRFINLITNIINITNVGYSALRKVSLLLLLCNCFLLTSQTLVNEVDGYLWFDSMVDAKNTNLHNGVIEVEKFRMAKGKHKFYHSRDFQLGTLLYEGQPYHFVQLKYDLYEDVVLIYEANTLRLENDKIDSFFIGDIAFVKLRPSGTHNLNMEGFFELLIDTPEYKFYKKHRKIKLDRIRNGLIYHDFKVDDRYFVLHQDEYYSIETKNDIIDIFPKYEKQLKKHSKKSSGTSTKEGLLLFLLERVNELVSTEKTPESE